MSTCTHPYVEEEKGIAARLVYMLKMSVESTSRDLTVSKQHGSLGEAVQARP